MYFLVQFDDGSYFICPKSKIINQSGEVCTIKYSKENKKELHSMLECYENENTRSTEPLHAKTEDLLEVSDLKVDNNPVTGTLETHNYGETCFESVEKISDFSNENELRSRCISTDKSAIGTSCTPVENFAKPEENKINIISVEVLNSNEKVHYNLENVASTTSGHAKTEDLLEVSDLKVDNNPVTGTLETHNYGETCFESVEKISDFSNENELRSRCISTDKSAIDAPNVLPTTPNPMPRVCEQKVEKKLISHMSLEMGTSKTRQLFCNVLPTTPNPTPRVCEQKVEKKLISHKSLEMGTSKTRQLFCMYCKTMQTKFARHLEIKHKNEEDVKKFIYLPKNNAERKKLIETIRRKSQFAYNTDNDINDGKIIVCRKRSANEAIGNAGDYTACPHCKGFFTKTNLRHHAKSCFAFDGKIRRNLLVMGRKLIGRIHPEASPSLKDDVFSVLREDDVVRAIRYDRLIILYGNKMCCKYRLIHQKEMIRANLRLLGRFLLAVQTINRNITELKDIYDPSMYDAVISALNVVGGFNKESNMYKAPSVAYNLGSLIKKIGQLFISDCIKRKNKEEQENAENFIKLLIDDISTSVNKTVSETQSQQFRRKVVTLPSNDDIRKLNAYLKRKRSEALREVTENFSFGSWLSLAESTLISTQIFNRRRAGEIERIFIEDFQTCRSIDEDSLKDLSSSSIAVANNYVRFEIRGKLNRSVPVLLSKDLLRCIEAILANRKKAGVSLQNRYLFGIPGHSHHKYLRACRLLRRYSDECGAKFPNTLRGTKLRKHVATSCINLDLSENDISDIANFLGHSEKIHKTIYRQPVISREILNISRILETVQGEDSSGGSDQEDNSSELPFKLEAGGTSKYPEGAPGPSTTQNQEDASTTVKPGTSRNSGTETKKKRSTSPYGPVRTKKRWSLEEQKSAEELFGAYVARERYPSLGEIQNLIKWNVHLNKKSPPVVKTWISNKIQKNRKRNIGLNSKQ
ncbi:unnamed protein product [Callosobruchus maculatus]|uniref:Uncharacterized protein n=1 Tax=Callosobruchus maculatus TaxID=64391 RepID=A0A653C3J2_CALMS|nr:unnamed protein product [Callosobruchus maculatus]